MRNIESEATDTTPFVSILPLDRHISSIEIERGAASP